MIEADYLAGNPELSGSDALVVVSGCSGGGKSALIAEMARRGYPVFPEPGRQIVKEELLIGGPALPWTDPKRFAERCLARAAFFFNSARRGPRPVLFDRSIIDAVTALDRLGALDPWHREAARRYRYARRVFLLPPWRALFAADAERRHDFAEAMFEYQALQRGYAAWGYDCVVVPRAPIAERADFLQSALAGGVA